MHLIPPRCRPQRLQAPYLHWKALAQKCERPQLPQNSRPSQQADAMSWLSPNWMIPHDFPSNSMEARILALLTDNRLSHNWISFYLPTQRFQKIFKQVLICYHERHARKIGKKAASEIEAVSFDAVLSLNLKNLATSMSRTHRLPLVLKCHAHLHIWWEMTNSCCGRRRMKLEQPGHKIAVMPVAALPFKIKAANTAWNYSTGGFLAHSI